MSSPAIRTLKPPALDPRLLPAINRLLAAGMRLGRTGKHDAVNKVLQLVPEWTRGDCWQRMRQLRKTAAAASHRNHQPGDPLKQQGQADPIRRPPPRRWTRADDDKLLDSAGYEPVDKIAQRLSRSVRAVRFRLCALGMSAKVTDGWSLRALRKLLRVSPTRLRQFIGSGKLRVRDGRVTAESLMAFCGRNRASLDSAAVERITVAVAKKRDAYAWERTANLLGVTVAQVQNWIAGGQLTVLDTFVTDRSFEEFCKKHGAVINTALMDPATAKWLVEEYGVPALPAERRAVPRAQKHALVVRTCKCGRRIAGNVYFRHIKACRITANQAVQQPAYQSSGYGKAVGASI